MFGTVHFTDGHTEPVISYNFNPTGTELYFTTESGTYGFKENVPLSEFEREYEYGYSIVPFLTKLHKFYRYDCSMCRWLVINDIECIELFTEVLH